MLKQRMKEQRKQSLEQHGMHAELLSPYPLPCPVSRTSVHIPGQELLEQPISSLRIG
jgi:hypothetical protein